MKARRKLNRLALLAGLGLSLLALAGQEKAATAATCPNGSPYCSNHQTCINWCGTNTAHACNLFTHCCICGT